MRKRHFPLVLVTILVVSGGAGGAAGLVLAVVGMAVIYGASLYFHPRTRHGRCNGTGEHHSRLFPWVHRKCRGCQGGRVIRLGASMWGAGHIRREHAAGKAARASARSARSWR